MSAFVISACNLPSGAIVWTSLSYVCWRGGGRHSFSVWCRPLVHLVGSLKSRISPGCRLAHSLAGCYGRGPRSQITGCWWWGRLLFAQVPLWPGPSSIGHRELDKWLAITYVCDRCWRCSSWQGQVASSLACGASPLSRSVSSVEWMSYTWCWRSDNMPCRQIWTFCKLGFSCGRDMLY